MKPQIENEHGECFDIEDIYELQHKLTMACNKISELESNLALARKSLEQYENGKWIKFDQEDESTWPNSWSKVIYVSSNNNVGATLFFLNDGFPFFENCALMQICYWQQLPEPPKSE